jgi:polar amino acid transport system ATP-binding protein
MNPSTVPIAASEPPLIQVRGLTKHYGAMLALDRIDFSIRRGEIVSIIGPSGSGKSTFIRCLNGLETASGGTIAVEGVPVPLAGQRAWMRLRPDLGMVFQDYSLFPHLSVLRNITLPPLLRKRMSEPQAKERAQALLTRFGLAHKADAYPVELSGGQQQRVAIIRALAMNPKVLLFDEPTSALDPETIKDVLAVMLDIAREGMTMVVVSHEIGFARQVADRLVFMEKGRIVEEGRPDDVIQRPQSPRLAEFLRHLEPQRR